MLQAVAAIILLVVGTAIPAVTGTGCPNHFDQVGEYCLHVSRTFEQERAPLMHWSLAREDCRGLAPPGWSTDLVTLKDPAKLTLLSRHIHQNFKDILFYVWFVGARQVAGNSSPWMWVDDTPVDIYSNMWVPDSPSLNASDHIGKLVPASKHPYRLYMLATARDTIAPSFVCEALAQ